MAAFALHITALVEADGREVADIAASAKLTEDSLWKYMRGSRRPRIGYELKRLAMALNKTPAELIPPNLPVPPDLAPKPRKKAGG